MLLAELERAPFDVSSLRGGTTGAGLGAGCTAGRSGGLSSTRTASPIRLSISSIGSGSRRGSGVYVSEAPVPVLWNVENK